MALAQRSNSRRTIILVAVFVMIVAGGGIFLYIQNKPTDVTTPGEGTQSGSQRPIVKEFSDGIFTDPRFTGLHYSAEPVIVPGVIGKPNPFAPTF